MPLVDYASSDEGSGNEAEIKEEKEVIKNGENLLRSGVDNRAHKDNVNKDGDRELFSSLPKPRNSFSFLEDDKKLSKLLLNKNSLLSGNRESVKIAVPSVTDFESDFDQPTPKKIKPNAKSVGLFSLLPPPKNNIVNQFGKKNLVPDSVTKNQVKQTLIKSEAKSKDLNNTVQKIINEDEDEDDTIVGTSFFGSSLVEQSSLSELQCLTTENISTSEIFNNFAAPRNPFINNIPPLPPPEQSSNLSILVDDNVGYSTDQSQTPETVPAGDNPLDLDEKALQILCGNKKKRQHMPMNVIDLSGEEIMPDSKEWLLKQFTGERRRGLSHKKTHGPSSQSRRKHQITYLAYQAKEQELELQNQWAQNRMSRKQTQSKKQVHKKNENEN